MAAGPSVAQSGPLGPASAWVSGGPDGPCAAGAARLRFLRMRGFALTMLLALPAKAQVARVKARAMAAPLSPKTCPADWRAKRIGDCWVGRAYVHRAGWIVDA